MSPGQGGSWIGLARFAGRYVMVGLGTVTDPTGSMRQAAKAWTSTDGIHWADAPMDSDADAADAEALALAAGGPGLVAVGSANQGAVAWYSRDGISWSRIALPLPEQPEWPPGATVAVAITSGPAGFLVEGRFDAVLCGEDCGATSGDAASDWQDPLFWRSIDGIHWTAVQFPDFLNSMVVAGGPGFIGAGGQCTDTPCHPRVIWTSRDGLRWDGPGDLPDSQGIKEITATAAGPDRILVVGDEPKVWSSRDGVSWLLAADLGDRPTRLAGLAWTHVGFLASGGRANESLVVLRSWDGAEWETLLDSPAWAGVDDVRPLSIADGSDRLVAVGHRCWGGCDFLMVSPAGLIPGYEEVTRSGSGSGATDPFRLSGDDYLVTWRATSGSPADCRFAIHLALRDGGSNTDYTVGAGQANGPNPAHGSFYRGGLPPGEYQFWADSGCAWTATITTS